MRLDDLQEQIGTYSKAASDVNRQLALAGIAVIWVLKSGGDGAAKIPFDDLLLLPLGGLVLALALDLLQYAGSAFLRWLVFRPFDRPGVGDDADIGDMPTWVNWCNIPCFLGKLVCVVASYILLVMYIASRL